MDYSSGNSSFVGFKKVLRCNSTLWRRAWCWLSSLTSVSLKWRPIWLPAYRRHSLPSNLWRCFQFPCRNRHWPIDQPVSWEKSAGSWPAVREIMLKNMIRKSYKIYYFYDPIINFLTHLKQKKRILFDEGYCYQFQISTNLSCKK